MQEIKKRRIVIASVLKPVDDTRMFEKFALTLAPYCEVHILGIHAESSPVQGIYFYGAEHFERFSFARLLTPLRYLRHLWKIKPDAVIITTHELIIPSVFIKILRRKMAFWYDVQENYYLNILHTAAFPVILRPLLANWVRMKESLFKGLFEGFFLAERAYEQELPFLRGLRVILENKQRRANVTRYPKTKNPEEIRLLFSGTLSESTGVFTAVDIARALYACDKRIRLQLIGYSAVEAERERLRAVTDELSFITLTGCERLVPHEEICKAIATSDFGIVSYATTPASQNRMPTKLFEYLSFRLPVLCIDHSPWVEFLSAYSACVTFKMPITNPASLLETMQTAHFFKKEPTGIYWEDVENELVKAIVPHTYKK